MRARRLEQLYGIWPALLAEKLREQDWECAICHRDFRMMSQRQRHIDHDHLTGKVGGILCSNCNLVLGLAYDNPEVLRLAADYLERFESPEPGHRHTPGRAAHV